MAHEANLGRDEDPFGVHPHQSRGADPRLQANRPQDAWPPTDQDYAPQFGQRTAARAPVTPQAHLAWQDEEPTQPQAHRRIDPYQTRTGYPEPPPLHADDRGYDQPPHYDERQGMSVGREGDPFAHMPQPQEQQYDLSQYRPSPAQGAYQDPSYAGDRHAPPPPGHWQDHLPEPHPPIPPYRAEADLQGDGYEPGAAQAEPYEDEYEEEGGGFKRGAVIAAALVGAIAVGAGLAYAYKLVGGGKSGGKPPILKANEAPTKALPSDPGGKVFAHTDKKYLNRLGEGGGAPASMAQEQGEGPRKVRTLVVSRAGDVNAPQLVERPVPNAEVIAARRAEPVIALPGVTLDGGPTRNTAPPPPPSTQRQERPAQDPIVISRSEPPAPSQSAVDIPPPTRAPEVRPTLAPPEPPKRERIATALRPAVTGRPTATDAPATNSAPRGGGSGYVAVVTSQRSSMDALKVFADLQQKYSSVLGNKTPEVQQANLGQKGTWYRLTVGPPGSRDAARGLCNQLKAQGFTGCWVKRY